MGFLFFFNIFFNLPVINYLFNKYCNKIYYNFAQKKFINLLVKIT